MANSIFPTVDFSPFFKHGSDKDGLKKAKLEIEKACSEYGFFLAVNHGVPLELMSRAIESSKSFFDLPDEEKLEYSFKRNTSPPTGLFTTEESGKREHLFMPLVTSIQRPPAFQEVMEDIYPKLTELGSLVESVINDFLGLPPDFLKEHNNDRSWDYLATHHYSPAPETEQMLTKGSHTDTNIVTFVFHDGVEGLEVYRDGKWIPIISPQGSLIVNVGDTIQVMSNDKLKSVLHRVISPKEKSRYSYAFFYNFHGDKMVQPLPHFTIDRGESPKYRAFQYKKYVQLRFGDRSEATVGAEDVVGISHYAI